MKYQKKYNTASDYLSDTHETNSVSMVSTDTLYYDGTAILTNTSSGGNIIVEEDGLYLIKDGNIYPVSHPDLSTQPSLLPYRIGKKPVYLVMIPSSEFLDTNITNGGHTITLPLKYLDTCIVSVTGYMDVLYGDSGGASYSSGVPYNIYYSCAGVIAQLNGGATIAIPDYLIVTYADQLENSYYSGSSYNIITKTWRIIGLPAGYCTMANMYVPSNANPNLGDTIGSMIVSDNDIVTTYPIICNYVGSTVGGTVASLHIDCHFIRHIGETDTNSTLINNGSSMNTATVTVNLYI